MSIGSLGGIIGSAAGAPLAQTTGSDVERAKAETVSSARYAESQKLAENAAGIAETDGEDNRTNERDADGRRPWELPPAVSQDEGQATDAPGAHEGECHGKDASGERGNSLDLIG